MNTTAIIATSMALNGKLSRALADVRRQLKSGKTRGANPRPLTLEEVQALELRRDQLQANMLEPNRRRLSRSSKAWVAPAL